MREPMPLPENLSGVKPPASAAAPQTTADRMAGGGAMQGEQATPQEQEAYERLVSKSVTLMHDPKLSRTIAMQLRQASDPRDALGFVTGNVVRRVLEAARRERAQIPMEAVMPAVTEIYENVVDIAEAAGAKVDEQIINGGFLNAVDAVRLAMVDLGMVTQQQAQADLAEMQQMEKSGQLQALLKPRGDAKGFDVAKGA